MNTLQLLPYVYSQFVLFMLIFSRLSALFSTFVLFRREHVNIRIVISLSALLSLYVLFLFPSMKLNSEDGFSLQWMLLALYQSFLGILSGLILNIVFDVFAAVGQIIAMQMGLGMATLIDPRFGSITTLTHFYMYTSILVFFLMNGHLLVIKLIVNSFSVIPVDHSFISMSVIPDVLHYSSIIFSKSVALSIVVIIATLIANLGLCFISKFSPQFNLFSVGINITLILGLACIYVTFQLFVNNASHVFEEGLNFLKFSFLR